MREEKQATDLSVHLPAGSASSFPSLDLLGVVEERDSKNALLFLVVGSGESRESTVVSLVGEERTYIT